MKEDQIACTMVNV